MMMTDERLKIWIDFFKWAVVSVGLVIVTTIIDTGFKERETSLNELEVFGQYVEIITDTENLEKRRILAQYFTHVTPSDSLRARWKEYYEVIRLEYKDKLAIRTQKKLELAEKSSRKGFALEDPSIAVLKAEIYQLDLELSPSYLLPANTME